MSCISFLNRIEVAVINGHDRSGLHFAERNQTLGAAAVAAIGVEAVAGGFLRRHENQSTHGQWFVQKKTTASRSFFHVPSTISNRKHSRTPIHELTFQALRLAAVTDLRVCGWRRLLPKRSRRQVLSIDRARCQLGAQALNLSSSIFSLRGVFESTHFGHALASRCV